MKISPESYDDIIKQLEDPSLYFEIPEDEPIYEIDLDARKVLTVPANIGTSDEHNATLVWFKVDRFYDDIDLFKWEYDKNNKQRVGNCWIQYTNANKESYFFNAPLMLYPDRFGSGTILIPWLVSHHVVEKAGTVEFSFQFFALYGEGENTKFRYIINTQPAKTKVLAADWLDPLGEIEDKDVLASLDVQLNKIKEAFDEYNKLQSDKAIYWLTVE